MSDHRAFYPIDSHTVQHALAQAEQLCQQRGIRWTALRRRVLEIIWTSARPLGAYDILAILQQEKHGAAPPTVYRSLDFLLAQGLIHRVASLGVYLGCHRPQHPHSGQFLICQQCGEVTEFQDAAISQAIQHAAKFQCFTLEDAMVELRGRCQRCQIPRDRD